MKDTLRYSISHARSYTEIFEGEFLPTENVLRVLWLSDGPSDNSIKKYIADRFEQLKEKEISKIYHDEPWHYSQSGVPYGLILVFFKS